MARLIHRTRQLGLLLWAGALVFAAGAVLDVAVHALLPATPYPLIPHHTPFESLAHTLTFVGLALLLAGVLLVPRPRPAPVPPGDPENERR